MESTIRVTMADNIATKPVKGNLCQGCFGKHCDDNMSKESGNTCMNPVARMIPAANDLTITKRLRSGLSAGIDRVTRGKHTPIMLVTRMDIMAMILSVKALDLLIQSPVSVEHSSGATDRTWGAKVVRRRKKIEMNLTGVEAIVDSPSFFDRTLAVVRLIFSLVVGFYLP